MRSVQLTGLVGLAFLMACQVEVNGGGGGGGGGGGRPARAPVARNNPPPPAPPPPAPKAATVPANNRAPAPAPAPAPSPNNPPQASGPAAASMYRGSDVVNVAVIKDIVAKNPKPCGYVEVAPNVWQHIDCKDYKDPTKAIAHTSARKLKTIVKHEILWKPIRFATFKKSNLMVQGGGGGAAAGGGGEKAGGSPSFGKPGEKSEAFPGQVDHRTDKTEGAVKDQGSVGSCTAFSLSSTLDNAAIRAGILGPNDTSKSASALHVWSGYGLPDMGAGADSNVGRPISFTSVWPYTNKQACKIMQDDPDCSRALGVQSGSWRDDPQLMAMYNKANAEGVYKIASIEKMQVPINWDEMINTLATGADVWASFFVDFPAWSNQGMSNGVIGNYTRRAGGHAITISGYRTNPQGKRELLIHNSWGESWGDKGYAWLPEDMVNQHYKRAFKVKITNGVKKEDLTDDDCAPDELIDIGTGLCAVMCANDTRPNNGCK